eukprot:jgi/Astpho2/315/Aster-02199
MLEHYKAFVRQNANLINAIEGGLSSLTWLLPDRFSDSELRLEAINSVLGLLSLVHESILEEEPQAVEVLVEIGAINLEGKTGLTRYQPLAVLEAAKAALRLKILSTPGTRMLTDMGMTDGGVGHLPGERTQDMYAAFTRFRQRHCQDKGLHRGLREAVAATSSMLASRQAPQTPASSSQQAEAGTSSSGSPGQQPEAVRLQAESHPQDAGGRFSYWWESPTISPVTLTGHEGEQDAAAGTEAASSSHQGAAAKPAEVRARGHAGMRTITAAEWLFILRPLLYVLMLKKYGRRSWKPWLVSLALEVVSSRMTAAGVHAATTAQVQRPTDCIQRLYMPRSFRLTPAEQREITRRKLLWMFYLIRSPFFEAYTRGGVATAEQWLGYIPLLGTLTSKAVEILCGIQGYYTYTAAS